MGRDTVFKLSFLPGSRQEPSSPSGPLVPDAVPLLKMASVPGPPVKSAIYLRPAPSAFFRKRLPPVSISDCNLQNVTIVKGASSHLRCSVGAALECDLIASVYCNVVQLDLPIQLGLVRQGVTHVAGHTELGGGEDGRDEEGRDGYEHLPERTGILEERGRVQ